MCGQKKPSPSRYSNIFFPSEFLNVIFDQNWLNFLHLRGMDEMHRIPGIKSENFAKAQEKLCARISV